MRKQHLAILSDNKPGVLTHIAGLISRKAINIESLTVGYTEEPDVSRFNIVISIEDDKELKQTISQLAKLIRELDPLSDQTDFFTFCPSYSRSICIGAATRFLYDFVNQL